MLDNGSPTVFLHSTIALDGHLAILNIQILQSAAIVRYALHPPIRNHITIFQAQLLQIWATFGQRLQPKIAHIAFANVQSPQAWTRMRQHGYRIIADCLAAACIQIAQFVATTSNDFEAGVRNLVTFSYGKVAKRGAQFGQFVQAKIGDVATIGYAQLAQSIAVARHILQSNIGYQCATSQIEIHQLRTILHHCFEAHIVEQTAIGEIEILQ